MGALFTTEQLEIWGSDLANVRPPIAVKSDCLSLSMTWLLNRQAADYKLNVAKFSSPKNPTMDLAEILVSIPTR